MSKRRRRSGIGGFTQSFYPTTPSGQLTLSGVYEFGIEVSFLVPGAITGIQYYRSASETGTHTGRIWLSGGVLLQTVVFANESASGLQTQLLATPFPVDANTPYIVSINANASSQYVNTRFSAQSAGNLVAIRERYSTLGTNGVFPVNSFGTVSYLRDLIFTPGG
jgi:hypothetical protein